MYLPSRMGMGGNRDEIASNKRAGNKRWRGRGLHILEVEVEVEVVIGVIASSCSWGEMKGVCGGWWVKVGGGCL